MTSERLRELIGAGESLDVEFKGEEARPVSDAELVESVVCLANRAGSGPRWLLVGVEDDGRGTGARPRHADGIDPLRVQALVANRTRPALTVRVETVPLDDKDVLVLPGGKANLEFVRLVTEESQAGRALVLDELLLLNHLWLERALTTAEAAALIQKPESEARNRLQRLVEHGLVEPRGARKGRTWLLSVATYRRLGERVAYVRQRGFEPLQQEQMVIQYVEKHGSISRSEVAELCQLSPPQAYRFLQALVRKGIPSKPAGRGRGIRYERKTR